MSAQPEPLQQPDDDRDRIALTPHDWGTKGWKAAFLVVLARTRNASAACRHVGVSHGYVYAERRDDPTFAEAWDEARAVGADLLEQVAWRRATVGEPQRVVTTKTRRDSEGLVVEEETTVTETNRVSDLLLRDQLRAAKPYVYGDRLTIGGDQDQPVQVEIGPRERTVERLAALYEIALEAGAVVPRPQVEQGDEPI